LLFRRRDLEVETVRDNVETRLNQAIQGRLDAVVLAWAGLKRLELEGHVTDRLGPPDFLPAVEQGALGIECRRDDVAVLALLKTLDDPATHRPVRAERAALAGLEGGCIIPMAAWARDVEGDEGEPNRPALAIDAAVFDPDGRECVAVALRGPRDDPEGLGRRAAQALRDLGAEPLLKRVSSSRP
jgi:hydroxymethylbilane synthase